MKALLVLLPGIAAFVLVGTAAIRTGEGDAQSPQVLTRHIHARATSFVQTDTGKKGPSAGDVATFTHTLTEGGKRVGRDQGYCVRILTRTSECAMTTFLGGGQIMVAGPFNDVGRNRLAITGGTGTYAHTQGTLVARRAGFFRLDLTYYLSAG
jgi:hypothetical protein